jgi:hypothetical protein
MKRTKRNSAALKAWITIRKNKGFKHDVLVPQTGNIKDYSKREKKQDPRENVTLACGELPKSDKEILSLTSFQCLQELDVNAKFPNLKFHAVEADLETFHHLLLNKKANNWDFISSLTYAKVSEIIYKAKADAYLAAFLDYCCLFKTCKDELAHAMTNNLVQKGGFIYLTVCQRGRGAAQTDFQVYDLVRKVGKGRYKIVYSLGYRDSTPMFSAIIKRVK